MKNKNQKTATILYDIISKANQINSFSKKQELDGFSSYDNETLDIIFGEKYTLEYLYYTDPSSNSDKSVFHQDLIDNVQCLIDAGKYLLKNQVLSPKSKYILFNRFNILGYLFDRQTFSYYVFQDQLKSLVQIFEEVVYGKINLSKKSFYDPNRYYKYLLDTNSNIEARIREKISSDKFGYEFDEEKNKNNLRQIEQEEIDSLLFKLIKIKREINETYNFNRFENNMIKIGETSDEVEIPDIEVEISEYVDMAPQVYQSIPLENEKNLGGRVALIDTNLEFEKSTSSKTIKFRTPQQVNFDIIREEENLYNATKNEEIEIIYIEIKK